MRDGFWVQVGAAWGFLAVAMGAFGAHGFKDRLAELDTAPTFQTAAQYHMYCALALLAVGMLDRDGPVGHGRGRRRLGTPGWLADLLWQSLRPGPDRTEMARRDHSDRRRGHARRLGGPGRGGWRTDLPVRRTG